MTRELSIIIIHHRTPGFLKLCLDSIVRSATDIDFEIIVVDSMSTRQSRDIVKDRMASYRLPVTHWRILSAKHNLGFSRGVNVGIEHSNGRYVLILNPDIVMGDDTIVKLLSYIKRHPSVGMIGPQLRNFNGSIQRNYFSFYKPITILVRRSLLGRIPPFKQLLGEFLMSRTDPGKIQTPDWIMGSALMVSRSAIEQVGLMDERFFMYFEDVDWARRFWHNGYKVVYYPYAVAYHYHQRESKSHLGLLDAIFNQKTRWHIRSAIKFFSKYRSLATPH